MMNGLFEGTAYGNRQVGGLEGHWGYERQLAQQQAQFFTTALAEVKNLDEARPVDERIRYHIMEIHKLLWRGYREGESAYYEWAQGQPQERTWLD